MELLNKLNLWIKIGRGYTIPQSIVPYIFAVLLASKQSIKINFLLSILGLIGVILVHLSVNMLDDYFDWKKGAVEKYKKLIEKGLQARTHKCFYVEENLVSINTVLYVALTLDFIACLIGLYIATKIGYIVIIIAIIAGILGYSYSGPPLKLGYRALGEVAIGIIFGPLIMLGAYITAGSSPDYTILFSSIISGLLIANVAHTHAIMDFKSDIEVGKLSLATALKSQNNAIFAQGLIYFSAYLLLFLGIILKIFPTECAITFITLPKVFKLLTLMKNNKKEKKLWMGIIENWEKYTEEKWFMMRLCISRNIAMEFITLLGITYYLFG